MDRFQLAVYRDTSDTVVAITEYLVERARGQAGWIPALGLVTLILEVDGRDRWQPRASLGILANLVVQFEAAQARLARGEEALVRSGVNDSPSGPFLLFEPSGETVALSVFEIEEERMGLRYPTTAAGASVEELYRYVREHRATLLAQKPVRWRPSFAELPFPRDLLLESLAREAAAGRQLYEALGQPFIVEIYA